MSGFLQSGRPPLILASSSKIRARLLEAAGLAFIVEPPGVDEAVMREAIGGENTLEPQDIAELLARAKAEAVSDLAPQAFVIGADQVLAFEGKIMSKPDSMEIARGELLDLSGKTHTLHTAVALAQAGETVWSHSEISTLTMRELTPAFIGRYLAAAGEEVLSSVGAYQLEGLRHPIVQDHRRRLFLDSRPSAHAAIRGAAARRRHRFMKRACVIGWPVAHSRSPVIHTYWLRLYGLDGAYTKEAVAPEQLAEFVSAFAKRGLAGANVTLPHKEAALALADHADAAATAIGAANTLWLDAEGRLQASNTDAYGFLTHLTREAPGWNTGKRPVAVLGAGGAARAILFCLIEAGASKILLMNRTTKRAEALAGYFGPRVVVVPWEEKNAALAGCGLLVNTTSLGMTGKEPLDIDLAALPGDAVVADIVYSPLETRLLQAARARGNPRVDGLGMLLHQAVPGFERWFGVRPEVTPELRVYVVESLEEK